MTVYPVQIKQLSTEAKLPHRASEGSSGLDLHALDVVRVSDAGLPYAEDFASYMLRPGERCLVRTGLALSMPVGIEAQVRSRSGLALKHGIQAHFGTIDADYRGDLGVILFNLGGRPFTIYKGDRVAQLVFCQLAPVSVIVTDDLDDTERGRGGFGHSGR